MTTLLLRKLPKRNFYWTYRMDCMEKIVRTVKVKALFGKILSTVLNLGNVLLQQMNSMILLVLEILIFSPFWAVFGTTKGFTKLELRILKVLLFLILLLTFLLVILAIGLLPQYLLKQSAKGLFRGYF